MIASITVVVVATHALLASITVVVVATHALIASITVVVVATHALIASIPQELTRTPPGCTPGGCPEHIKGGRTSMHPEIALGTPRVYTRGVPRAH